MVMEAEWMSRSGVELLEDLVKVILVDKLTF